MRHVRSFQDMISLTWLWYWSQKVPPWVRSNYQGAGVSTCAPCVMFNLFKTRYLSESPSMSWHSHYFGIDPKRCNVRRDFWFLWGSSSAFENTWSSARVSTDFGDALFNKDTFCYYLPYYLSYSNTYHFRRGFCFRVTLAYPRVCGNYQGKDVVRQHGSLASVDDTSELLSMSSNSIVR